MTNTNQLIQAGAKALKAGERDKAHQLLMQAVQQDEQNEKAWLWLSGAVKTKEERRVCLENVLTLNPDNATAKKGLTKLGYPIPEPPPPKPESEPEPDIEVDWATPYFDPSNAPAEVNDPHVQKFQDVWSSNEQICAYCAHPIKRGDKRCANCKRPLIGKELVNPSRSRYLTIWVILRSVGHLLLLFGLILISATFTQLPLEFQIASSVTIWLFGGIYLLISGGLTAALYFRQAWAYWLAVIIIIGSIGFSFAGSIMQANAPTPVPSPDIPGWLSFVCALPFIVIQVMYIYMVFMAFGDFKKEKMWRIAAASEKIKEPMRLDKIGQMLAKRSMWASAIMYWQRAAGLNPGNTAILRRLANGYAHLGFYERSLDTLNQALEKTREPKVREQVTKQMAVLKDKLEGAT
ncbi:MAG: hypothetical protein DWQ04_07670 [Chloroflexi bacterium]|nr:MAG: hypothetical protein DWQ04_07670 [Chloroflexota bacterium]